MNVLEGLYAARASISPERFWFGDWHTCTCGHIYGAAHAGLAEDKWAMLIDEPNALEHAMLRAVVEANGIKPKPGNSLRAAVSDATKERAASTAEHARRNAAVLLISTAIEKLEGEQQRAMLDVKARAETAVGGPVGELAGLGAGR